MTSRPAPLSRRARVLLNRTSALLVLVGAAVAGLAAGERARLVTRLRAEQARSADRLAVLETVLDTVDVAIVACDAAGTVTLANRTARDLQLDAALDSQRRPDGTGAPAAPDLPLAQALRDGHVSQPLLAVRRDQGPPVTLHCVGRPLRDRSGAQLGAVVVHTDVTALLASEQQFRAAFDDGPTPMARLTHDGTVAQANAAMRRLLALPTRRLLGAELAGLAVPEDRQRLRAAVAERSGRTPVEARLQRIDGRAVWCELTATLVRTPDGQAPVVVQVLDVHARKTHELALEDVAHRDALTGLGNRHVLDRRLEELRASRDASLVLAYLDLDGFKQVNDAHGHEAGDAVLRATGARLLALVRSGDLAVRLGGDEFVLACPVPAGAAASAFARALVERVEAALREPVLHGGTALAFGVSVGTALAAGDRDAADVLHEADLAMYASKRARSGAEHPAAAAGTPVPGQRAAATAHDAGQVRLPLVVP